MPKGFGAIGEKLQIIVRKTDDTILTNVNWDDIIWSEVKEIGLKSSTQVIGFHKNLGCMVWYPLAPFVYNKPLFYVFEKAWGKIGTTWHRFYITITDTIRTPYHIPNTDILPDERRMGWTGTIDYAGNGFDVDVGIKAEPMGFPQSLKTKITTPIDLDDCGIEYQFYLNPDWAPFAEKNVKWVRAYTVWDPEHPENNVYTDYDITQFMEIINIPSLAIYGFEFYNQDKTKCLGHFNFDDIFQNSQNRLVKIESVTLPDGKTTYCIRVGASFGPKSAGEFIEIDPTFGNTELTGVSGDDIGDWITGGKFQMGATGGTADSITAKLKVTGEAHKVKCAIYNMDDSLVANGVTEEISVPVQDFTPTTFDFVGTKPTLVADTWYFLCVWAEYIGGDTLVWYQSSGGSGMYYDDQAYNGFPDPWAGNLDDADGLLAIYCTYSTEAPPAPPPANPLIGKPLICPDIIKKAIIR